MPTTYSKVGSGIRPYTLSDSELLAIGRLIRACAEIEDIVDLYLNELAEITEGAGIVLLGRMPVSARLKLIKDFAAAKGGDHPRLYKEAFDNDSYRMVIKCRNTIAHGYLLGLTDADEVAFQVRETQGLDETKVYTTVNAYGHGDFQTLADMAEDVIPQIELALGLKALREKRRLPTLSPHTKSQGKGKQIPKGGREPST